METVSPSHVPSERLAAQVRMPSRWRRAPAVAGAAGVLLLLLGLFSGRGDFEHLAASWLVALLFVVSIALGCMFFVLVQFAARAGWSVVVRRIAENVMASMPVLALLFLPVLFAMPTLFSWARDGASADALLRHKSPYLNTSFFLVRALAYFAIWTAIAWYFRRQSVAQDDTGSHAVTRRLQMMSAPALILYALTVTFASFDWMMSLQPKWFSTAFGVYWFSGCVIAGFATLGILAPVLRRAGLMRHLVTAEHLHDIGKLLFAFVAFWTYIAFSQYFLIWYASLPEETPFYLVRWHGAWRPVSIALAVGHFALPFFFLLPRLAKRRVAPLVVGSVWMLAMHYLDLYWLVMPVFHEHGPQPSVADAALLLGMSALLVATVAWWTGRGALIPVRDPRLPESLSFENV
jgi:hypothetical protein